MNLSSFRIYSIYLIFPYIYYNILICHLYLISLYFYFFSVLENLMTFWESFVVDGHNSSMGGQRNQILLASFFFRPSLPYRKFMGGLSLCITPIKPANIWWLSLMVENLHLSGWIHPWNLDLYPFLTEDLMLFAATTISSFGHKPLQACVCPREAMGYPITGITWFHFYWKFIGNCW